MRRTVLVALVCAALGVAVPAGAAKSPASRPAKRPVAAAAEATRGYLDFAAFSARLRRAVDGSGGALRMVSIGRTRAGRDIWVVAAGADASTLSPPGGRVGEIRPDPGRHPSMLVVGGVDATQLAGSEEALRFLERLARDRGVDSVAARLANGTVYVVPRVSPDACERYFQRPQAEAPTNLEPADDDRDGAVDEDGPDDLDGDGLITLMRVEDPAGEYVPDPADPRLLRKADGAKGEAGRYKLYSEGRDDDRDGKWNEDGPGGIDFSRNWPFGYRYFTPGSGPDPMTGVENRALADFMFDHASIAAVFVFGAHDNLVKPWKADPSNESAVRRGLEAARDRESDNGPGSNYGGGTGGLTAGAGPAPRRGGPRGADAPPPPDPVISSPPAPDAAIYDFLAQRYQALTGRKDGPDAPPLEGDLGSYAYYDFGRWAFTARPWWPTAEADSAKAQGEPADGARRPEGGARGRGGRGRFGGAAPGAASASPGDTRAADLKALESRHVDAFLPWHEVEQPDFPGQKVEVGGLRPYVTTVPPAALLDSLADGASAFLFDLAGRLPRLEIRGARAERLGPGLSRVTADVVNRGYLPTNPVMGTIARWPRDVRVLAKPGGGRLVAGHGITVLEPLAGSGGFRTVSFVVEGGSGTTFHLEADSPTAGAAEAEVRLP